MTSSVLVSEEKTEKSSFAVQGHENLPGSSFNSTGTEEGEEEEEEPFLALRSIPSLELLRPPHESTLRKSTLLAATFNMVATVIGGGILSIPLSFQRAGLVLGTLLFFVSATATAFSLYILCSCSRRTGCTTYTGVVSFAFGPGMEFAATLLLFIFLVFVVTAYMVLLKNIWSPIINASLMPTISFTSKEDTVTLSVLVLLMSPLLLRRDLHALRHNCYVGFISVSVLCCALAYRAYGKNTANPTLFTEYVKFFASSWSDALFALPFITLNFMCSFNVLSVHGALINPNRERVQFVINASLGAAFVVTYFFGVVGYLYAYDDTKGNILLNFDPKDSVILLGRIGYGVTLMAAIPMVTVPCRDAFLSLVPQYSAWKYQRSVHPGNDNCQPQEHENKLCERTTLLRKESDYETASLLHSSKKQDDVIINKIAFYFATSIILLLAFFGATFAPGVAAVWSICGSGMAFIIAFILPAACYIKIRQNRKGHRHRIVVVSWILLIGSIICAIACDDAVKSLTFNVALRKISDSPIASSRESIESEGYVPNNCYSNSAIVRTISWQEKLLDPRQAITRLRQVGQNESLNDKEDSPIEALVFTYTDQEIIDLRKHCVNGRWSTFKLVERDRNKEDPYQEMKIVAAVDINHQSFPQVGIDFHEEVICSVRLHGSGRLTVKPCASGNCGSYNQPTYVAQFNTPKGVMYEYSFEWFSAPLNNTRAAMIKGGTMIRKNQQFETISLQLRHRRLHLLRNTFQRRLEGKKNSPRHQRTIIQIVSANSTTDDILSVDYSVELPDHINCEDSSSRLHGSTAFTSSFGRFSDGNGVRKRKDLFIQKMFILILIGVFSGMTQKVLNNLSVLLSIFPCVYILLNSISGVWALQGIFQDQPQFFFDATIDFSYQMASSKVAKAEEKGTVSLRETFLQQPFPKLVVKLISKSGLKTKVEGYAAVHIPIDDLGTHDVTAHLWRPTGGTNANKCHGLKEKLEDYYIGGAYHLLKEDIFPRWKPNSAISDASSTHQKIESRFGMRSDSSGDSIQIRVTNYSSFCIEQTSEMLLKKAATRQSNNRLKKGDSSVDELVSRLRRNRVERKIRHQFIFGENQELLPGFEASSKNAILIPAKNDSLMGNMVPNSMEAPPPVDDSVGTERTTAVLKKIQLKKVERSRSLLNENHIEFL